MCCLVNHGWYDIALLCLWQQLDLDQEGVSQHHGLFSTRSRRSALMDQLASKGHLVRTLTIPDCRSDVGFLRQMIRCMPRLETITVDRVALGHYLSVLTQLVDESGEEDEDDEDSQDQLSVARTSLRSLRLPHVTEAGQGTEMLLELCRQNPGLRRLELVDSELDDSALTLLSRVCPDLTSLNLSRGENLMLGDEFWTTGEEDEKDEDSSKEKGMQCCLQHHWYIDDEMATSSTPLQQQRHGQKGRVVRPFEDHVHRQLQCDQQRSQHQEQQSVQGYSQDLVFCLGISNTGFQRLFDSLSGYALRSINLEFTLVEDSGLVVLAQACGGSGLYREGNVATTTTFKPTKTTTATATAARLFLTTGLTSICVNHCSKVTHEGIRALIDYCPRLEALEFVGCDAVSAQVFDPTRPWRCTGLKRLVFTLQPAVLMPAGSNASSGIGGGGGDSEDSVALPPPTPSPSSLGGPTTAYLHSHATPIATAYVEEGDRAAAAAAVAAEAEAQKQQEEKEEQQQRKQRNAIRDDYHAMFRQLKRLTRLESLHLYNSPSVNAHLPCVDEDVALATAELVETTRLRSQQQQQQQQHAPQKGSKQQKQSIHHQGGTQAKERDPATVKTTGSATAATVINVSSLSFEDDPGEGSSRRVSFEGCGSSSPYIYKDHPVDEEYDGVASPFSDTIAFMEGHQSRTSILNSGEEDNQPPQQQHHQQRHQEEPAQARGQRQSPLHTALHPFTFHAGLKALGHLRQLRALTLYERATVVLGSSELRWMGKTFPCLQVVKLKGAIHPHGGAVQALALSRPRLDIQVCRLFDE
ncbi:hypothetical protein DFQ27_003776 [Actinomortierella ambigua]|uniref:Uncharacterized protein n=1 Tax=Actinomortierella ambigua TaxID=1343610 RepID=A0A9P6U4A8_9FUNG|nr:hypothetical protein DFQ27_003776 [Actinomortierella ambigua]